MLTGIVARYPEYLYVYVIMGLKGLLLNKQKSPGSSVG